MSSTTLRRHDKRREEELYVCSQRRKERKNYLMGDLFSDPELAADRADRIVLGTKRLLPREGERHVPPVASLTFGDLTAVTMGPQGKDATSGAAGNGLRSDPARKTGDAVHHAPSLSLVHSLPVMTPVIDSICRNRPHRSNMPAEITERYHRICQVIFETLGSGRFFDLRPERCRITRRRLSTRWETPSK